MDWISVRQQSGHYQHFYLLLLVNTLIKQLPPRIHTLSGINDPVYNTALDAWLIASNGADIPQDGRQSAWDEPLVRSTTSYLLLAAQSLRVIKLVLLRLCYDLFAFFLVNTHVFVVTLLIIMVHMHLS
jgi:hypothetical protein